SLSPNSDAVPARGGNPGDAAEVAAHLRLTLPFTVPDTAPTPEPIALDGRDRASEAPSDAVAAPTRPSMRPSRPSAPTVRERPMPKVPLSTAPDSLPPPKESAEDSSGPSPACPQCESPMAWVEEHLRFYCKSCRMYF